jgi:hypothetical protein
MGYTSIADFCTYYFYLLAEIVFIEIIVGYCNNILHEIRKGKANWICHFLRRNCNLRRVTEGKIQGEIEVTARQGRRRRKLLDDLKERR